MLIQGKNSNISHVLNHLNIGKDVDGELLKTAFKELFTNTGLGFFSIEDLIPTFDSVYGKKIFAPNPLSFGLAALVCPVKYTKLVYGLSHYNIKLSASVLSNFGIRDAIISTCTDDHLRYIDEFGLFKHNYYLFLKDSSVGEVQKMNPIQEIGVPPYSTNGCLLC